MPWKKDAEGHIVMSDDKPIWVHADGKEAPFDTEHTLATITRLNGENKQRREEKEALEQKFAAFEGIDDPEAARAALGTVKNLSAGELKTAEQVAEMQKAAQKTAEEQVRAAVEAGNRKITDLTKERDTVRNEFHGEKLTNAFARSKYAQEKVAVPLDMLQHTFGGKFKIEEGKIVGHDNAGNKIYSRVRNGELADFDEALESLVDSYAYRDSILKGTGSSGSGAQQSRNSGGANSMTRAEFDRLTPAAKAEAVKTRQIVD